MPPPWRTLFLIYRLPADEYAFYRGLVERTPASVAEWSEGNALLEPFDVREASRPIQALSEAGDGGLWVSPRDCRRELDRWAPRGTYDSVIVLWSHDDGVPVHGWGYGMAPSDDANGAGFSSCVSNHWRHAATTPHPEEGFVHEWLHQVGGAFRALGLGKDVFPDLHDAGALRSCRADSVAPFGRTYGEHNDRNTTWQPWYRDYMTGTVRRPDGDGSYGIGPRVWELRA